MAVSVCPSLALCHTNAGLPFCQHCAPGLLKSPELQARQTSVLYKLPMFRRLIIAVENELRRKLTKTGTKGAWQ